MVIYLHTIYKMLIVEIVDIWGLLGLGNPSRFDTSFERQPTCGFVGVQCRNYVYLRCSRCFSPGGPPRRHVSHHRFNSRGLIT